MKQIAGFTVLINPGGVDSGDINKPVPAHDLILRPILKAASLAVVLGAPKDSIAVREAASILTKERGRLRMSLGQEVIRGFERLWNSGCGSRGAIAIKSQISEQKLASLFRYCGDAFEWNRNAEKEVYGLSGLRFAIQEAEAGHRVFMLSKSNGIQWLGVYAVPEEASRLFEMATMACKPFARWFEVSDPSRYNIIGQYDKVDPSAEKRESD